MREARRAGASRDRRRGREPRGDLDARGVLAVGGNGHKDWLPLPLPPDEVPEEDARDDRHHRRRKPARDDRHRHPVPALALDDARHGCVERKVDAVVGHLHLEHGGEAALEGAARGGGAEHGGGGLVRGGDDLDKVGAAAERRLAREPAARVPGRDEVLARDAHCSPGDDVVAALSGGDGVEGGHGRAVPKDIGGDREAQRPRRPRELVARVGVAPEVVSGRHEIGNAVGAHHQLVKHLGKGPGEVIVRNVHLRAGAVAQRSDIVIKLVRDVAAEMVIVELDGG
mmetsp:Transcript_9236/g.30497  ORF Transcript_9236/g.30497 Transcript_9236/m.30497 type:complete len:284 (-) Transcript_9236:1361-2212(-)